MALSPPLSNSGYLLSPSGMEQEPRASVDSGHRSHFAQRVPVRYDDADVASAASRHSSTSAPAAAAAPIAVSAPARSASPTRRSTSSHSNGTLVQEPSSSHEKSDVSPKDARRDELRAGTDREGDGPAPPFSASFLDSRLKTLRSTMVKTTLLGTLLTVIAIFAFLPIYWGALWKTPEHVPGLNGFVVDFDGGAIGQAVLQTFPRFSGGVSQMTWEIRTDFANNAEVEDAVVENRAWAAVVVNAGATQSLQRAIFLADSTYNGSQAVYVYTNSGRNQYATQYITAGYQNPLMQVQEQFSSNTVTQLAGNANLAAIARTAPQILTTPMSYLNYDLRPFDVPVATAIVFVGLIYVLIFSFILTMQAYQARQPLVPYLRLRSLLALRIIKMFFGYFALSIAYSLISLAFQAPFDRKFGHAGFVVYWMLVYCSMLALGFALEMAITVLGPKFIPFFLTLWVISNVAVTFYPIDLLPGVFRYGWAMPFANFSDCSRTILFRTKNKCGQNFGILLGWIVAMVFLMVVLTIITHKLDLRKHNRSLAKKRNDKEAQA